MLELRSLLHKDVFIYSIVKDIIDDIKYSGLA